MRPMVRTLRHGPNMSLKRSSGLFIRVHMGVALKVLERDGPLGHDLQRKSVIKKGTYLYDNLEVRYLLSGSDSFGSRGFTPRSLDGYNFAYKSLKLCYYSHSYPTCSLLLLRTLRSHRRLLASTRGQPKPQTLNFFLDFFMWEGCGRTCHCTCHRSGDVRVLRTGIPMEMRTDTANLGDKAPKPDHGNHQTPRSQMIVQIVQGIDDASNLCQEAEVDRQLDR